MKRIGKLESLWRYPVKSMRGEQIDDVFVACTCKHNGFTGVYAAVLTEATVSAGDEIQLPD